MPAPAAAGIAPEFDAIEQAVSETANPATKSRFTIHREFFKDAKGDPAKAARVKEGTKLVAALTAALAIAACSNASPGVPVLPAQSAGRADFVRQWWTAHARPVCRGSRQDQAQCDLMIESAEANPGVGGWGPSNLQQAYDLPSSSKGSGQIVAIVDAYDNPNVASDLAAYRLQYGLGSASFFKYNQEGQQSNYPRGNRYWGGEIDLDVEMVSASCPLCTIYLIEADNNRFATLKIAEAEAVKLGARIVSNSWGGHGGDLTGSSFETPGGTYLAIAGDSGYGMQQPASYERVVSVGGTVLRQKGSRYSESVWRGTGGGCSAVSKPAWQHDPGCSHRTGNDVAAVATGVAEYDTYGHGGWMVVGGTSISSPLLAGVYGLAGNASSQNGGKRFWTLKKRLLAKALHVISKGTDGCPGSLNGSYLCTAGTGQFGTYSGPTGWGTPNGIGAF
jgi:subtilase family serine protease